MVDIPVIQCAKCNRPVEMWETYFDVRDNTQKFVVRCHGESEQCTLDMRDGGTIIEAIAFRDKGQISAKPLDSSAILW